MFKGHPKGLIVLFFSNMGERFGYYTMMAIFILFMEAKFGLSAVGMGLIWSGFLFSIYFLPLFGGILADKIGYGKTIATGIVLMFTGYGLMAVPGQGKIFVFCALFIIALGTGFFKGNLVVILGNLYESQGYKKLHDAAFNIYYMGINIGAFFAPFAATFLRDWIMGSKGFTYDARIPGLANEFTSGSLVTSLGNLSGQITQLKDTPILGAEITQNVSYYLQSTFVQKKEALLHLKETAGGSLDSLAQFSEKYNQVLSQGYNAGFAIAAISIVLSLFIFLGFKKYYKHADYLHGKRVDTGEDAVALTPQQTKDRIFALLMVFAVVIFFWMAFHQNGLILTWFAKNYTVANEGAFTNIFFDLPAFLSVIGIIIGLVLLIGKKFKGAIKGAGAGLVAVGGLVLALRLKGFSDFNPISPELFQAFNPIFVVFLTPLIIGFFAWLSQRNKEPSSPKKIGIGMMIMAAGWVLMVLAAQGLASPSSLKAVGGVSPMLVTSYWLIGMYFTLTVAELFISPMGLAFVAKVSPPKFRGMMQGGWLAATAIGNSLSGIIATPYSRFELWQTFGLLVLTSVMAGAIMFLMLRKLERITGS